MKFTQQEIYEASFCLISPYELQDSHCTVTMIPPKLTLWDYPVIDEQPLTVPFVQIALDGNRRFWMVDLPGLSTLGWVDINRVMYEQDSATWLKHTEQMLLDQIRAELEQAGMIDSEWYHYFTWQPILSVHPAIRTLAIGAYLQSSERDDEDTFITFERDQKPRFQPGHPKLN